MQENHETFTYTYSAQEQAEIRRIRDRYLPPPRPRWTGCAGWSGR